MGESGTTINRGTQSSQFFYFMASSFHGLVVLGFPGSPIETQATFPWAIEPRPPTRFYLSSRTIYSSDSVLARRELISGWWVLVSWSPGLEWSGLWRPPQYK